MCDYYRADEKTSCGERFAEAENVHVVGDAEIGAYFVLLDVGSAYDDDDFCFVGELREHPQLAVRLKSGQNPRCVIVVEQLAAEFEI